MSVRRRIIPIILGATRPASRCLATALLAMLAASSAASAASPSPLPAAVAQCRRAGDDDTVRPYDPALATPILAAYRHRFPHAAPPSAALLAAQTNLRCMNHRLWACFTGANLPCGRMNAAPENQGAEAFCRASPDAEVVPMSATGHDTIYAYRCVAGRARITGRLYAQLDRRGFAPELWTPLVD